MAERLCRSALSLLALGLAAGCPATEPLEVYGLPAVHLAMDTDDVARLRAGTSSGTDVPVEIELRGERIVATMSVAGVSSVDDLKKNFNIDIESPRGRFQLRLNAMSRDPSAVRGYLAWTVFERAGFETPPLEYVTVFLNGDYLGLYLFHETLRPGFFELRGLRPIDIFAARRTRATMELDVPIERAFDSRVGPDDYTALERLIAVVNEAPSAQNRRELEQLVDIDRMLRYMAVSLLTDNRDGIDNNYVLVRTLEDGRFAIWPWDLDFSFRGVRARDDGRLFDRNALMRRLFANADDRRRFDCLLEQVAAAAPADDLIAMIDQLTASNAEAFMADRVLTLDDGDFGSRTADVARIIREQHRTLSESASLCDEALRSAGSGGVNRVAGADAVGTLPSE